MLSFRDGWDHYLLILACLYGLWIQGNILWEEYSPNFHHKKGECQNEQPSSKPDECRCLMLHFGRRLFLLFSKPNIERDSGAKKILVGKVCIVKKFLKLSR